MHGIFRKSNRWGVWMMGLTLASIYLIPQRIMMWSEGVPYSPKHQPKRKCLRKSLPIHVSLPVRCGIVLMLTGCLTHFLEETITSVSNCNTAMSMLVIGMILADADPKTIIDRCTFYTFIRLLIIPFCVFIPCWLLHIDSLVMGVKCNFVAAMPAGATTTILASKYDCEEEFSVKLVVFSTAASLITTPLWDMILLQGNSWFAAGKGTVFRQGKSEFIFKKLRKASDSYGLFIFPGSTVWSALQSHKSNFVYFAKIAYFSGYY